MKIIHSCTSNSFSGLERYVVALADWQNKKGYPVALFCRKDSEIEKQALNLKIPLLLLGNKERASPFFWFKNRKLINKKENFILHMHAGGELWFFLPWLISKRFSKTILQYHLWINHWKKDPLHFLLFSQIQEIWASTESAKAHLQTLLPVSKNYFRVVPYGRNVDELRKLPIQKWREAIRRKLQIRSDEILAACLSRIEPIKGVSELFDAFVSVAQEVPYAHLALVGDASPADESAKKLAGEIFIKHQQLPLEIKRRLHLMGFIENGIEILSAADFYVLPSYEECMSLALLDAMCLGLAVIGTNSGGTPSVLQPEHTGILVPPRNMKSLSDAMKKLFTDHMFRKKLGLEAQRFAEKNFNQEEIFKKIYSSYSDVMV